MGSGLLEQLVTLPPGVDERSLAPAVFERGVLVEDARRHWADGSGVPPALVLGYGAVAEPAIGRAIATLGAVVQELRG